MIEAIETLKLGDHPMTWQWAIQTPKPYKYAIVRHNPNRGDDLNFYPDTVRMNDVPVGDDTVGHQIPILPPVWKHLKNINNTAGYFYAKLSQAMWINLPGNPREIDIEHEKTNAVSVLSGGNFVAYDDDTDGHIRVVAYHYTYNNFDPFIDNWLNKPWLFWMPVAINKAGVMRRVANGIDVQFPLLRHTELWLPKSRVELFPAGDYNYRLVGCNVYDGNLPLLTVTKDRVRIFHRAGWNLDTIGVIPPK